ncbi:DUF3108 domain-containing protein [candidate division KSB1 bacterium]|nr:DUF3108 domain-containing protein [candidate division KSB1 bacterium]
MSKYIIIITFFNIISMHLIGAQTNPVSHDLMRWEYSISYMNIPNTNLTFLIDDSFIQDDQRLLRIEVTAKTYGILSRFFWVDNQYEALIEPESFLPVLLSKQINQKNIQQNWTINYDHERNLARLDSNTFWILPPACHNFFSMLFYLRAQSLKIGEKYQLNLDVEKLDWLVDASVKKKDRLKVGDQHYSAIQVEIIYKPLELNPGRSWKTDILTNRFAGASNVTSVWYRDDACRTILRVDYDSQTKMILKQESFLKDK